jgi:hypothetical protein
MQSVIDKLRDQYDAIYQNMKDTNTSGKEHGSPDQTRGIILESIFTAVLSHIESAIDQLKIIDRELY